MTAYNFDKDSVSRIQRVILWAEKMMGWGAGGSASARQTLVMPWYFGKLVDNLTYGNTSATFRIWKLNDSEAWEATTADSGLLEVYAPPWVTTGSIASGTWLRVAWHYQASRWYAVGAPCDG